MHRLKGPPCSLSSVLGQSQSLMCRYDESQDRIFIEPPNRQVRQYFKAMKLEIPGSLSLKDYTGRLLAGT